jgi:hypothetical protein
MRSSPPPLQSCSVCQATLDPNGTCPRCRAPGDWTDQIEAVDFVLRRLGEWHQKGQLTDRQQQAFAGIYEKRMQTMSAASSAKQTFQPEATFSRRDECWSCKEYLYTNSSHCQSCGAPITDPGVRSLRYLNYLCRELVQHEESGLLTLRQAHDFLSEIKERIAALQRKLERDRAPFVLPVDEEPRRRGRRRQRYEEEPVEDEVPRRNIIEVLLDPQTIQWLLAGGGALIVLGLVIWLASLGLFENAGFVAVALGLGNGLLLAGGWALLLRTSHQHAGRALTLLACLVMPLNLWFYHTHDLLTLENNLWVAALFCCIVYTVSALVLKDSLFVYVLVGGITLTGMLILAQIHHFGEILAPTTFLIVLGLICLHAERAFPDIDSSFSRRHFGMAFYWCSVALFASGLLLLLCAQFFGWVHGQIWPHDIPWDVVNPAHLPWTLALVLVGTYAYVYSDLVVRRIGVYIYFAAITILWAEIQILVLADLARVEAIVIIVLALTAAGINLFQVSFEERHEFLRRVAPLGVLLSLMPVAFGVLLHFRATNNVLNHFWRQENGMPFVITWAHVGAMAVTALCCRAGAYLYRYRLREVSVLYFFLTAIATLLFAAGLAWMIGVTAWEAQAPLVMIVPILYLLASYLYRGHTPENPLIWAAHGAVVLLVFFSLWVALGITPQVQQVVLVQGRGLNLLLALSCLEAAFFYGLAAFLRRTNWTIYLATVMLCGAIWQFLKFFNRPDEFYAVAFAVPGFILIIVYRTGVFEKMEMTGLERATFQSANALTTLGFAAGALLSLSRVFLPQADLVRLNAAGDWHNPIRILLYLLIPLTIISLLAAWLVQHQAWRRVYLVLSIVNGIFLVLVIHRLISPLLTPWQWLEIFSLILGVALLGFANAGWYRETERSSDLVTMAFLFGSLALVAPLLLAIVVHRINHDYRPGWDDLGLIVSCIALFGSGVVCRIRASTLIGSAGMVLYLLVILIGLHRHLREQWIVGIYLTLGGVLLFGTGLILSVYRDKLLALPDKIRRREGVFRIFDWR